MASNRPGRALGRALLGMAAMAGVVAGAVAATTVLATSVPAGAASNGAWSIFPAQGSAATGDVRTLFDFSARAGQSVTDAFTLANDTAGTLHFDVYSADAYDIADGGGFALRGYGQPNVGVGTWIHLPASVAHGYSLPADSQVTVPFTLAVPSDATPGDHAGGIVALNVVPEPSSGSRTRFEIRRGVGVRVYLHVLGPVRPALAVSHVRADVSVPPLAFATGSSSADVSLRVRNTGNTLFSKVRVEAYATDAFGTVVQRYRPTVLSAVLPGSEETVTEPEWRGLPFAGPVTVHVRVVAEKVDHSSSTSFWVVPWLLIVLVVVVLAALAAGGGWLVRRRRARRLSGSRTGG